MVDNNRKLSLFITIIALTIQKPEAFFNQRMHILPWVVLPGISTPYRIWSSLQRVSVGDEVVFVFVPGFHTVAEVTKEGYDNCDATQILSVEASSPATFNLQTVGEHYFICTVAGHCPLGQKVTVNVPDSPSPPPPPVAALPPFSGRDKLPDGSVAHIVGDRYGWAPPPSGSSDYTHWASSRTFLVGDKLVFNFVESLQDVALVTKSAYEKCNTNNTINVLSTSPATVTLNATGDYYFTTTNPSLCNFGQQLAISVRSPVVVPSN